MILLRQEQEDAGSRPRRLAVGVPIDYHAILFEAVLDLSRQLPTLSVQLLPRCSHPWAIVTNTANSRIADIQIRGKSIAARIISPTIINRSWWLASPSSVAQMSDFVMKYLR